LVTLRLPAASVQWHEEGKECIVGDRLFDVKEMEQEGSILILRGLYDEKEKALLSRLYALSSGMPREKERAALIFRITHMDMEEPRAEPIQTTYFFGYSFPLFSALYVSPSPDIQTPPPRLS